MKQSRAASLFESLGGTAVGFIVALLVQWIAFPLIYGVPSSLNQDIGIIAIFTAASVIRSYFWRRFCELLHIRHPISPFMLAVIAERRRQIEAEGWTLAHDDEHPPGDLALAGVSYAQEAALAIQEGWYRPAASPPMIWPWSRDWWKPLDYRRDLVKGCTLIAAEGDKFDRNRKRAKAK